MIVAFLETASSADQISAGLALAGFAAVIHGAAYNAAEGALRVQRVLLKRGADANGTRGRGGNRPNGCRLAASVRCCVALSDLGATTWRP